MKRISVEEYRTMTTKPRANKHGARKVVVGGLRFDSIAESRRFEHLQLLARAGVIHDLVLQPSYSIETGIYRADFRYVDSSGVTHVEDVKGQATPVCRMKLKLMARLGVLVELVTKESHPQYWKGSK